MSENRGEKQFERWTDKQARLHLPTPAYFASRLPARVVNPAEQRYWHENPHLCARRDLKGMIPGARANINGYVVTRKENQARLPYVIDGKAYTFADAVNVLSAGGTHE